MNQEAPVYRVKDWDQNFEGAKSRTYNNKSTCQMPTKHGLGYRKLIRRKNGPALFGAWCALIQVLSRHPIPRQGYCTDTGRADGRPFTATDLELLTDIPEKLFAELLQVASGKNVAWLGIQDGYRADTEGIHQGGINSDSDSDSDSNSDAARGVVYSGNEDDLNAYGELNGVHLSASEHAKIVSKHGEASAAAAIEVLDTWLAKPTTDKKAKSAKSHYAYFKSDSWVWERVTRQNNERGNSPSRDDSDMREIDRMIAQKKAEHAKGGQ